MLRADDTGQTEAEEQVDEDNELPDGRGVFVQISFGDVTGRKERMQSRQREGVPCGGGTEVLLLFIGREEQTKLRRVDDDGQQGDDKSYCLVAKIHFIDGPGAVPARRIFQS